jgi:hypothetical protein
LSNYRLIPLNGNARTIAVNGRGYSVAANSFIDVVDFDAQVLAANGFIKVAAVGTTANRPATPSPTARYFDTTVGVEIVFNGANWVNPVSGASV